MSGNFWKGYKVLYKIIQEGERVGLKPKPFLQFLMESHEKKKKDMASDFKTCRDFDNEAEYD